MESSESLTNQLLIAMPGMADPNFSTTVTLVCEHNDEGALGIVINRPLTLTVGGLFEQLSRDIIDAMATGTGPSRSLVALGYAGWDAGQLEGEMLANSWLNVPATPEIVFDMPFTDRWEAAARAIGIDLNRMSPDAGHA